MTDYPVQLSKVQAPPLRDETLERVRLLDWLHVKIHRRVVLVTAEAGYGKTTLLADFSRRSRIRTLWYRLDRGDRDWVGFVAHMVAAIRVHLPTLASVTQSLLRETGATAPPLETVLDTFIRELGDLPADSTALILDDVHAVDDSVEVRTILRELVARAPERMTFVLISRKVPPVPLARLRARGEVAELRTAELRFDAAETDLLFRETYSLKLEPSVVAELSRRTEGWAASLQLVRAAIRDRTQSEIRSFVNSLSGAEGDLYDYLAEEVVGELSSDLQQFLMRTSVLDVVEPILGSVASGLAPAATRAAISEGELIGLFSRTGPQARDHVRAHPLVRDFLVARLVRSTDEETITRIHHQVAIAAEAIDWRIAGHHYVAAGRLDDARRVLGDAIESILATGAYAAADAIWAALPQDAPDPLLEIVRSRIALQLGDRAEALTRARTAVAIEPALEVALWNALMISVSCSALDEMRAIERQLRGLESPPIRRLSSKAIVAGIRSSVDGDLDVAARLNATAAHAALAEGNTHFYGVALTNLAQIERVQGQAGRALDNAHDAIVALESTSAGVELVSARLAAAWAEAHLGHLEASRDMYRRAITDAVRPVEASFEAADIEVFYGDRELAEALLAEIKSEIDPTDDVGEQATLTWIATDVRRPDAEAASRRVESLSFGRPATGPAIEARRRIAVAEIQTLLGRAESEGAIRRAKDMALRQHAYLWSRYADCLGLFGKGRDQVIVIPTWMREEPVYMSMAAELCCRALDRIGPDGFNLLKDEARRRPERWRPALRSELEGNSRTRQLRCAEVLEEIGTSGDIPLLRRVARRISGTGRSTIGRSLARRLAPRVWIEDLGRVEVQIGGRAVDSSQVRRKVLALPCLLLTKQGMAASREELLEALWPAAEPSAALNSLNQTVYFLRRVFEPEYQEDLSPGYVEQSSETLWLDQELISSRSRVCRDLLHEVRGEPTPDQALSIAHEYRGRFALDFLYEDWSSDFRNSLHAGYLRVIEAALRLDMDSGHYLRGIEIAQLAAEVEPDSEDLQLALLRLYRLTGSLAAAAEQYGHYSHTLREIGIEPQPMSSL